MKMVIHRVSSLGTDANWYLAKPSIDVDSYDIRENEEVLIGRDAKRWYVSSNSAFPPSSRSQSNYCQ